MEPHLNASQHRYGATKEHLIHQTTEKIKKSGLALIRKFNEITKKFNSTIILKNASQSDLEQKLSINANKRLGNSY